MRYKIFGRRTGLHVSALALGTGNFGTGWGHGAECEEAKKIFDGYVEAGGNFIDTADGYQGGQAEVLVGEFIAADRDHFVVATKYTLGVMANDGMSHTGNSRRIWCAPSRRVSRACRRTASTCTGSTWPMA
jgi:aryl-alcohol dehydrogenase-like predicted oxidoreductase